MRKMKKSDWGAIVILILVFQILSMWSIDISTSAMMAGRYDAQNGNEGASSVYLTNGFIKQNPLVTYHISLFWLVISSFLLALVSIHHIDGDEDIKSGNKNHFIIGRNKGYRRI